MTYGATPCKDGGVAFRVWAPRVYRQLIALRKRLPALNNCRKDLTRVEVCEEAQWLKLERGDPSGRRAILLCNFSATERCFSLPNPELAWRVELSTAGAGLEPKVGAVPGFSAVL